jgi:hypothetical protein
MRKIIPFLFFLALFMPAVFAQNNTSYDIPPGSSKYIDTWTPAMTVTNNCPKDIYVPVKTAEEWDAFLSIHPSCVNTAGAICGDGICDSTENSTDCPADCDSNIWPDNADVTSCYDSAGNNLPTIGKDSVSWFLYGSGPTWKTYNVTPNETITLSAFTDDCAPCVCYHMHFCLSEFVAGVWQQLNCFDWGDTKGASKAIQFTPYENETPSNDSSQNRIRINATGCFYFYVNRILKTR